MQNTEEIFARYEQIKKRLPSYATTAKTRDIADLGQVGSDIEAVVFDAFGVLNVGESLISGADLRLDELRAQGRHIRILTNAASYDHNGAITKFAGLGLKVEDSEIITSRMATLQHLSPAHWGVICSEQDTLLDLASPYTRLNERAASYQQVEGFLFLSTADWNEHKQALLEQSLQQHDRPVLIANADLVAPRDDGFSLEPGYYGHRLVDQGAKQVRFFGKPYPEVYEMAEASLPSALERRRILMCGDSLHTDIIGGAARGWQTALITRDGLFANHSTETYCQRSAIHPDWRMPHI